MRCLAFHTFIHIFVFFELPVVYATVEDIFQHNFQREQSTSDTLKSTSDIHCARKCSSNVDCNCFTIGVGGNCDYSNQCNFTEETGNYYEIRTSLSDLVSYYEI